MKTIFTNDGLIDLLAVSTFGVNVKTNQNPIGYFGTGLKYAIAVILRNNGKITLYRGKQLLSFTVKSTDIRDKAFNLVCMNGRPLGFTTELGKNWEMWQAFRELYCNTMDENGNVFTSHEFSAAANGKDKTTFVIDSEEMANCYIDRSKIVLLSQPRHATALIELHDGPTNYIYYRNIRVHAGARPYLHTYNLMGKQDLTEDRTLASTWRVDDYIGGLILASADANFIKTCLTAPEGTAERALRLDSGAPSPTFIEVVKSIKKSGNTDFNLHSLRHLHKTEREAATPANINLNSLEAETLAQACYVAKRMGATTLSDYEVLVVESLGEGVLGLAEDGKIFISRTCVDQGASRLAGTIFEEWAHLAHSYYDCSRQFQNYLLDRLTAVTQFVIHSEAEGV